MNIRSRRRVRQEARLRAAGFSLIELMIVIVILGVLSTMVVLNIAGAPDEARVSKAKADIQTLESALILYKVQNGFYPTTEQGLKALVEKPTAKPIPRTYPPGGYLKQDTVPMDPWGNPYIYRCPGEENRPYEIISRGADGLDGGTNYNADVKNWQPKE